MHMKKEYFMYNVVLDATFYAILDATCLLHATTGDKNGFKVCVCVTMFNINLT